MPRTSRHKSSKHSSREYSDSEKDSSLKERKAKEESVSNRSLKESASGEKRKYDSKPVEGRDLAGAENVDFVDEYVGPSSKKRKERVDDDRWAGGDTDERESLRSDKDLKGLNDSKSRSRRGDDSSGLAIDVDEGKRSGSKVDAKHHRSERKDKSEKEGGLERDRKGKEHNTSDKYVDGEAVEDIAGGEESKKHLGVLEDCAGKHLSSNSGVVSLDARRNPDHEKDPERWFRKKDSTTDMDKYLGGREVDERRLSSRNEILKPGKYKDDGHEDDRYKDKYAKDVEKDSRFRDDKQQHRDGRHSRDYARKRSDEKYTRKEKNDLDVQEKNSKTQDNDREHGRSRYTRHHDDHDRDDRNRDFDLDRDGDHDGGRDLVRDRGRDIDHDRGRDMDRDRGRDRDRHQGRVLDRDRERERYRCDRDRDGERDRARDLSNEHGREWDYDHDRDYTSQLDDRSSRYKEDRSRRRSPDDYDDYYNDKTRSIKVDSHADREKSMSRRTHSEAVAGSSRGRTSPGSRSLVNMDKYRDNRHDDFRYGDSRDILTTPDKVSKYTTSDKNAKLDDDHFRDPSAERSPRMKKSPLGLLEKSPSSTSIDRKYASRSGRKRSLDVDDEAERRSSGSNDVRDSSINDDRQSKDFSSKREHSPAESSFHHRSSQANGSSIGHGPPSYEAGADSPLIRSVGEDNRGHSSRYRRSVDPNPGRSHGNPWKGVPNWPTPLQNGFMPFPPGPHGPPHGGFPSILPQFPSPLIFGVRPPVEMNHSGIPYHLPDADRFNHMRPLGWQNLVDARGPSHFQRWDGNNGIFREEPPIYGPGSMSNGRGRDTSADVWKPNGDVKMENDTKKDGHATKNFRDEPFETQSAQGSHTDNSQHEDQGKNVWRKTPNGTPIKEGILAMTKVAAEKAPQSPAVDNRANSLQHYLSALDISVKLTNPELYNEFVSLAVIEQNENAEEEDVNVEMEKAVDSELTNGTMGISIFPAAEDSIFQRAMDLYKTHGTDGKRFCLGYGDESNGLTASEMKVIEHVPEPGDKQVLVEKEMDEPVHYQEIQGQSVEELSSDTVQIEQVETKTPPISGGDVVLDPSGSPEVAVKENIGMENTSPPKSTFNDALNSNTDDVEMRTAEAEIGDNEHAPCVVEQLGSEVDGSINLPHGSVKVCEGLMPVSNESESVTLTPVHHAPESTH